MSRLDITYVIVGVCAIAGLAAFLGLVLAPAVSAYSRGWHRVLAGVLSFYVLAAMVLVGVLGAVGVYELWISYG